MAQVEYRQDFRLILLEMLSDDSPAFSVYHNRTAGIAVVPFNFGSFPLIYELDQEHAHVTGEVLFEDIKGTWSMFSLDFTAVC